MAVSAQEGIRGELDSGQKTPSFKMDYSRGWRVVAGCFLGAQPGCILSYELPQAA